MDDREKLARRLADATEPADVAAAEAALTAYQDAHDDPPRSDRSQDTLSEDNIRAAYAIRYGIPAAVSLDELAGPDVLPLARQFIRATEATLTVGEIALIVDVLRWQFDRTF